MSAVTATDYRRAAAAVVHYGRGDTEGLDAVLAEVVEDGRGVALIVALLGVYNELVPELRTELAQAFLSERVMKLAGIEADTAQ